MSKNIKTRIQNKHDLEVNWRAAAGFIPLQGEIIVYDVEVDTSGNALTKTINGVTKTVNELVGRATPYTYERFKIGDGIKVVSDLPFVLASELASKAEKEHGTHVVYGTANPEMNGTATVGTAASVARSDHKHPTDTTRAAQSDLKAHTDASAIHITSVERTDWNAAKMHADSTHAPSNAEKNQNAFSNITVGSKTIAADSATDTLTIVAGDNVTLTADDATDAVTIAVNTDSDLSDTSTKPIQSKAVKAAITDAKAYTDTKIDTLISYGTADPSASVTSQFYFKYSTE